MTNLEEQPITTVLAQLTYSPLYIFTVINELDNEFYNNLNYEDTYEKVMKLFN